MRMRTLGGAIIFCLLIRRCTRLVAVLLGFTESSQRNPYVVLAWSPTVGDCNQRLQAVHCPPHRSSQPPSAKHLRQIRSQPSEMVCPSPSTAQADWLCCATQATQAPQAGVAGVARGLSLADGIGLGVHSFIPCVPIANVHVMVDHEQSPRRLSPCLNIYFNVWLSRISRRIEPVFWQLGYDDRAAFLSFY